MAEALIILEDTYTKSTYYGAEIELYSQEVVDNEVVDIPIDLTDAVIFMNLVANNIVYKGYSTELGSLSTNTNKIIIPEHVMSLAPNTYQFDFNITLQNGVKMTGFGKGEWTILPIISK